MPSPRIVVHDLAHVRAALAAAAERDVAVAIESAPGAAAYLGPSVFKAMLDAGRAAVPSARAEFVLDCGTDPGLALAAIRHRVPAIRLKAPPGVRRKVADIARRSGIALLPPARGHTLDLRGASDPLAACRAFLARH
jgi:uncharacterized protein (DUF2236 family)